jgi:hypothetical protein
MNVMYIVHCVHCWDRLHATASAKINVKKSSGILRSLSPYPLPTFHKVHNVHPSTLRAASRQETTWRMVPNACQRRKNGLGQERGSRVRPASFRVKLNGGQEIRGKSSSSLHAPLFQVSRTGRPNLIRWPRRSATGVRLRGKPSFEEGWPLFCDRFRALGVAPIRSSTSQIGRYRAN